MTSDAWARPRNDREAVPETGAGSPDTGAADIETTDSATAPETDAPADEVPQDDEIEDTAATRRQRRRERAAERATRDADDGGDGGDGQGAAVDARGPRFPVVPALTVLLVLLLAGAGFLWFTRPATSSIRTTDYVGALEAARSGVVDLTSFDYLTLDDDVRQIQAITTGDLQKESVAQLNQRRKDLTDSQAVVNTKIIGAGVTQANPSDGTVVMVIETTQKTKASSQAAVARYRIEVQMKKVSGRWLLSGISGL